MWQRPVRFLLNKLLRLHCSRETGSESAIRQIQIDRSIDSRLIWSSFAFSIDRDRLAEAPCANRSSERGGGRQESGIGNMNIHGGGGRGGVVECSVCHSRLGLSPHSRAVSKAYDRHRTDVSLKTRAFNVFLVVGDCILVGLQVCLLNSVYHLF